MTPPAPAGVAWITSGYPWDGEPIGGIFFQTQARAIVRQGTAVTVVSPIPWAPWPLPHLRPRWRTYAAAPRSADDAGVAVARPRYAAVPGQPSMARPDRVIAAAVWRDRAAWAGARLVHGHYAIQGLAAWRVAGRARLPFVITFHGDDLNTWPELHPERLADLRTAAREAGAVIGVSQALVDRVREIVGIDALHLPIGVDHGLLESRRVPRTEARRLLGLPGDRTIALFVGTLQRKKGVHEFVEAVLGLGPPFLGIVVGDGEEAGHGIADPRARGVLEYRGRQPNAVVATYLCAADVLVLPSHGEGLPTILVEAGALGVPVIASPVGGIPDLLGEDRGRLLGSISAGAVADALQAFAADRPAAEAAAGRLGRYVRDHYDAERNAARLIEIYRSLAPALSESAAAPTSPTSRR